MGIMKKIETEGTNKQVEEEANQPVSPDANQPVSPDVNQPVSPDANQPVSPDVNQQVSDQLNNMTQNTNNSDIGNLLGDMNLADMMKNISKEDINKISHLIPKEFFKKNQTP